MSKSRESQHSHLLLFSQTNNESSAPEAHFIHQLHEKYGIPLVQLERIYLSTKSMRSNESDDTTELDYGQKLTLNHNILKEMITIIDSRSNITKNIHLSQSRANKRNNPNIPPRKIEEKLNEVKNKLQDLISFICQEQEKSEPIQIKKVVNLSDINQASYFNASLQYSKDFPEQLSSKQQEQKIIVIDQNKLDEAKEVTSQFILSQSTPENSKLSQQRQNFLKSSLDRISEVQSGETIERQAEKNRQKESPYKASQQSINVKRSQHSEEQASELDETGKIILSTINKKITKTSKLTEKGKEGSKLTLPANQSNADIKNQVRKSKFWKNNSGKLENLAQNFAVSHESIQESKAFQRSRFKFDQFNKGFTFKSLDSIDRQTSNQQSRKHYQKFETHQLLNSSKHHLNEQKRLRSSDFHGKYYSDNAVSNVNISKLSSSKFPSSTNGKFNESMIVSSFPSQHDLRKQRMPQPINNHRYGKAPLQLQDSKWQANQISSSLLRSNQNSSWNQFATAHFLEEKKKPRQTTTINPPPQSLIKRPQSVPHFNYQEQLISQNSPRMITGNVNQMYRTVSTPLILAPPQRSHLHLTVNHSQLKPAPVQSQASSFSNPYISASRMHYGIRSDVYQNIYDEIAKDSDKSSDKSVRANPVRSSQRPNTVFVSGAVNFSENKLRKKGILLTNSTHRNFSRRLT